MDNPEKLATGRRQTKQQHNTICVGHHYAQYHYMRLVKYSNWEA